MVVSSEDRISTCLQPMKIVRKTVKRLRKRLAGLYNDV